MIAELICRIFHARTNAHILHLTTRSYAEHVALAEFYEAVTDIADQIAEGYQGKHGLIDFTGKCVYRQFASAVKMIDDLAAWVEENRYEAVNAEETCLHNVIDELLHLCSTTTYKLRFLK